MAKEDFLIKKALNSKGTKVHSRLKITQYNFIKKRRVRSTRKIGDYSKLWHAVVKNIV